MPGMDDAKNILEDKTMKSISSPWREKEKISVYVQCGMPLPLNPESYRAVYIDYWGRQFELYQGWMSLVAYGTGSNVSQALGSGVAEGPSQA
jgi:hypothetical protein